MSENRFSALMPSVLRLIGGEQSGGVHLAAQESKPLAEWGGCFRTEDDVEQVLQILEPLLVLLSLAGYGVPEVVLSAQGVPQPDRISVAMPSLEIRRGTARSWDADPLARVGLRVCPTATNPLDLGTELATFKLGFGPKVCGWLLLPVSEADPRTSLDDSAQKLWLPLSKKVAAARAGTGVAALIDTARTYSPTKQLGMLAALPGLVAKASMALQSLGAAAMLEAEFAADRLGKQLSEQMQELQALSNAASSLLARVESKGLVATTTEAFWGWWHDGETEEEPQDAPSLCAVEALGWARVLLSCVGTTQVQDTGKIEGPPTPQEVSMPLARLMEYRRNPEAAKKADWTQLPFIHKAADGTLNVMIKPYIPKYDPCWRKFASEADPYPEFEVAQPLLTPIHTLDFARYWFNLGDTETHYVIENAPIEAYINGHPEVLALVTGWIGESGMKKVRAFKELLASGNPILKGFWCSGLTLITLGAAGYDLQTPLTGKNGKSHGYVDNNGWEAIRPWMLIDGQLEATAAMGVLLREYPDGDLKAVNGLTVYLTGDLATIRDHSKVDMPPKEKTPTILKGDVVKDNVPFGKTVGGAPNGLDDESMYDEGTYCKATKTDTDYQDSAAVRFGPGAVELMGIGQRVSIAKIRPGDIGQLVYPVKTEGVLHYVGRGHAFQIWEVQVRGPLDDPGAPNAPVPVGDGLPDADGNVLFVLNQYTKATKLLDESVKIVAYRVIEANLPGSTQGLAATTKGDGGVSIKGDGGVSISAWKSYPPPQARGSSEATRYYFARLHESPWSDANLSAKSAVAAKGAAAVPSSSPLRRRRGDLR